MGAPHPRHSVALSDGAAGADTGPALTSSVSIVPKPKDHADQARLLRRVLDAFRPDGDSSADRAMRRRVEGAIIASELAAGEPAPRLAGTGKMTLRPARQHRARGTGSAK